MATSTTTISPPCLQVVSMTISLSTSSKKSRKLKQLKHKQKQLVQTKTSTPTPLLINHKPYPTTKLQALNDVVNDLESSLQKGIPIEPQIFSSLLETCFQLKVFDLGFRVHRLIPISLLRKNTGIYSKLVKLYSSGGLVEEAHDLFDQMPERNVSAFCWNYLISGYSELGMHEDALALYFQMEEEGVVRDEFTFPRVLKACGGIGVIRIGEAVHRDLVRLGFGDHLFVQNALVDMYAKCGDIVKARRVFDQISGKDSISWNSMTMGYFRHGLFGEALQIVRKMVREGIALDSMAVSSVLANVVNVSCYRNLVIEVHGWVVRRRMEWDLSVANSLIVAYSSRGMLDKARWLFDHIPERDIVSWNSIIYAHRRDPEALTYFASMEKDGVSPDKITFVSILSACAHMGLVEDGERLFLRMKDKYKIEPIKEHYACMVNLYGRAGLINEAYSIVSEKMEVKAGPTVWGALLYACYLHKNVDIGEIAAENLFELEPDNELNFELLMKIYDQAGRAEDVQRVRTMMVERGL